MANKEFSVAELSPELLEKLRALEADMRRAGEDVVLVAYSKS